MKNKKSIIATITVFSLALGVFSFMPSLIAKADSPAGDDTQVQFNDNGYFGGNPGFTFNPSTHILTLGSSGNFAGFIQTPDGTEGYTPAGTLNINGGIGYGDGDGGLIQIQAGSGGGEGGVGGNLLLTGGTSGGGGTGHVLIADPFSGYGSFFDPANTTAFRTLTFPDASGTFSLLQSTQTFSGVNTFSNAVNNFISGSDSTIHVGSSGIKGCIVMGDSDGSGVTYVTANNGVLSATTSPPANCN